MTTLNVKPFTVAELKVPAKKLKMSPLTLARSLNKIACHDCGVNSAALGEWFMLSPQIWEGQFGLKWEDNMCLSCCEKRLGRPIKPFGDLIHFPDHNSYPWMRPMSATYERIMKPLLDGCDQQRAEERAKRNKRRRQLYRQRSAAA